MEKTFLNFREVLEYTGFSKSYLYKLTSGQILPCYKPGGKLLYFRRSDIDAYLLSNRRASIDEIRQEAHQHAIKLEKKGGKHV
jgi:putative excisionase